jgi:hypothetical protein
LVKSRYWNVARRGWRLEGSGFNPTSAVFGISLRLPSGIFRLRQTPQRAFVNPGAPVVAGDEVEIAPGGEAGLLEFGVQDLGKVGIVITIGKKNVRRLMR